MSSSISSLIGSALADAVVVAAVGGQADERENRLDCWSHVEVLWKHYRMKD